MVIKLSANLLPRALCVPNERLRNEGASFSLGMVVGLVDTRLVDAPKATHPEASLSPSARSVARAPLGC
jgi:hypothetical protein